jgi:hypothetical protein
MGVDSDLEPWAGDTAGPTRARATATATAGRAFTHPGRRAPCRVDAPRCRPLEDALPRLSQRARGTAGMASVMQTR